MAHEIEWLTPAGTPSPDKGRDSVEETAAHTWATWRAIQKKARTMGMEAEARLALHHRTGAAHIKVTGSPPRKLDAWVVLEDVDPGGEGKAGKNKGDRSAMSIEFGWTTKHGKPVKGLHILGGVMDRAIARYSGPQ